MADDRDAGNETGDDGDNTLLAIRLGALAVALEDLTADALPPALARTGPDAAALNTVFQWPGIRIDGLARILGMSHSGTVRVADRLVRAGLIERRPDAHDARAVSLHPTSEGRSAGEALQSGRLAALEGLLAGFPAADRRRLAGVVGTLLRRLADTPEAADRICRLCEERVCTLDICPTERWARRRGA